MKFPLQPTAVGGWDYVIRVQPVVKVSEFNAQHNEQTVSVQVFDRPTKVLLLAGGPMRDDQFVRNLLYRHKAIDVDVLLQTAAVGSSQESNNLLLQLQADLLGVPVVRPRVTETTALGAAFLAGLAVGIWPDEAALAGLWQADRRFEPTMAAGVADRLRTRWQVAVRRSRGWESS